MPQDSLPFACLIVGGQNQSHLEAPARAPIHLNEASLLQVSYSSSLCVAGYPTFAKPGWAEGHCQAVPYARFSPDH